MATGAIRAGQAFIELLAEDNTSPGIKSATKSIQAYAKRAAMFGAAIAAAGSSVVAGLTIATKSFVQMGGELKKVSTQTGATVESLSELKYAAAAVGVEFEDVVGAMEESAIRLGEAARDGTGPLADALKQLGVNVNELLAKNPADRLEAIGNILKGIKDINMRGFVADELLGGDAFKLLPMLLGDMRALRAESKRLNLGVSPESAKRAGDLSAAWNALTMQSKTLVYYIGDALAEPLTVLFKSLQPVLASVIEFVKNNQGLIRTIAAVAGAFVVVGTTIAGIAGAVTVGTMIFTALGTVVSTVGAIIGFLATPTGWAVIGIGLLIAAVSGLVYWFATSTEAGKKLSKTISDRVVSTFKTLIPIVKGVWDALMSGDWKLAGTIIKQALGLAMTGAIGEIKAQWLQWKFWFEGLLTDIIGMAVDKFTELGAKSLSWLAKLAGDMGNLFGTNAFDGIEKQLQGGVEFFRTIEGVGGRAADNLRAKREEELAAEMKKLRDTWAEGRAKLDVSLAEAAAKREASKDAMEEGTTGVTDAIKRNDTEMAAFSSNQVLAFANTTPLGQKNLEQLIAEGNKIMAGGLEKIARKVGFKLE